MAQKITCSGVGKRLSPSYITDGAIIREACLMETQMGANSEK
jgi:hypothetical protein